MKRPVFLTLDDALAIHAHQIDTYGGSPGVRDIGLLESALGAPQATFGGEFLHSNAFEMAAAGQLRGTGLSRSTKTDGDGNYALPALPIGVYDVTASRAGFGTLHSNGVTVAVGSTTRLPVS